MNVVTRVYSLSFVTEHVRRGRLRAGSIDAE